MYSRIQEPQVAMVFPYGKNKMKQKSLEELNAVTVKSEDL